MKCDKISVIMSVYNCDKYIQQSVESVMNQTYTDFEFIIIDDGSLDNTATILSHYQSLDARIRVFSRENKGVYFSLNEALSYSTGNYIAVMDGDDIWYENKLKEQVQYMNLHKDIDILGTFVDIFGEDYDENFIELERWFNLSLNHKENERIFLENNCCIAHPSVIIKREIINTLGGYDDRFFCGDYNLWLRAIKAGFRIDKLEKKLVKVRRRKDSISKKQNMNFDMTKHMFMNKLGYIDWSSVREVNNYVIWGASNGGRIAYQILKDKFANANCTAFIDSFQNGFVENIEIFRPTYLENIKFDYIFIATSNGRVYASEFIENKLELTPIKDFLWLA